MGDVIRYLIGGILVVGLMIFGVILMAGRGSFLIAGYNTATKEEKGKFNEKALCRFIGLIAILSAILLALIFIGGSIGAYWLSIVGIIAILALVVFSAVYANTKQRFRA